MTASGELYAKRYKSFAVRAVEGEAIEPQTFAEAMRLPEKELWKNSMKEELDAHDKAGTWTIEDVPADANPVGCRWVFKIKRDANGNVIHYKSRLVAQGFSQIPGIDYFDTYAPTAKLATTRTLLAFAAFNDWELHQIDVKSAYLNGEFSEGEVVWMKPPPGFSNAYKGVRALRIRRPIYGLKQSARRWYEKFVEIFEKLGFTVSGADPGAFYRRDPGPIIVIIHVDDCTIGAPYVTLIEEFKRRLVDFVEISDLGELHWLLGIEICRVREKRTLSLSQSAYIDTIIRRFNFEDLKPVTTPLDPNIELSSAQAPQTSYDLAKMRDVPYREAVGSLMYAAMGTRPDIAFAVSLLSRFATSPGPAHWEAVKRVFRYLKGTRELRLTYGPEGDFDLKGYGDADGNSQLDRHAISGNVFILFGGAISWFSKRQEIIALSTTESEYVAATHTAKEALWLRKLFSELFKPIDGPTTLYSDNQSAIALTKDSQYHARTKHIDIRFHFIRLVCQKGCVRLLYCPTAEMTADILTKALPSLKVKHFASALGLRAA